MELILFFVTLIAGMVFYMRIGRIAANSDHLVEAAKAMNKNLVILCKYEADKLAAKPYTPFKEESNEREAAAELQPPRSAPQPLRMKTPPAPPPPGLR
jgi:uncharacterized protein (UPF0333 family)